MMKTEVHQRVKKRILWYDVDVNEGSRKNPILPFFSSARSPYNQIKIFFLHFSKELEQT